MFASAANRIIVVPLVLVVVGIIVVPTVLVAVDIAVGVAVPDERLPSARA